MPMSSSLRCGAEERLHGISIQDPYRWLEDGSTTETRQWVSDQQRRYDDYFSQSDDLGFFRNRVREYLDVENIDQPLRIANQYFYRKRDKGCEQACIYVRDISSGLERLLVRPPASDKYASIGIHRISVKGSLLAYELRRGGSDRVTIRIIDVDSGFELDDKSELGYARGFTFAADQTGFFYSRAGLETCDDHTILFHRFSEYGPDTTIFRTPKSCSSRLILTSDQINLGAVFIHWVDGIQVIDLSVAKQDGPTSWKKVLVNQHRMTRPLLSAGRLFVLNFLEAPNGVLRQVEEDGCESRVVIPEQSRPIEELVILGDRVICTHLQEWGMVAESWSVSGRYIGKLDIPTEGTIRLLQPQNSDAMFCTFESSIERLATFELLPDTGEVHRWYQQRSRVGQRNCDTKSGYVCSKDGTRVPLMLISERDRGIRTSAPALITGYGGFGTSVTPQYSVLVSIMLELGATFALTRIRGGGEFGGAWHDAGRGGKRQNAFDDFIAVAEWLHSEGITSADKLAVFGGSNAGLLVGVVITQRPELFAAALCIAPLLDMIRYEKFDDSARWRHEYGSVSDEANFRALYAYSPYHHIRDDVDYPAVLFICGDKDDRCNPAHVRKTAALLQQRPVQTHPILVDYDIERGHSPVLPLSVRIESLARRIIFLCRSLNITDQRSSQ